MMVLKALTGVAYRRSLMSIEHSELVESVRADDLVIMQVLILLLADSATINRKAFHLLRRPTDSILVEKLGVWYVLTVKFSSDRSLILHFLMSSENLEAD